MQKAEQFKQNQMLKFLLGKATSDKIAEITTKELYSIGEKTHDMYVKKSVL